MLYIIILLYAVLQLIRYEIILNEYLFVFDRLLFSIQMNFVYILNLINFLNSFINLIIIEIRLIEIKRIEKRFICFELLFVLFSIPVMLSLNLRLWIFQCYNAFSAENWVFIIQLYQVLYFLLRILKPVCWFLFHIFSYYIFL